MLSPIDRDILDNNPRFQQIYKELTSSKLSPDGSSQTAASQKKHSAAREKLKAHQIEAARSAIFRQALLHISGRTNDLPEELQEVTAVVAAQLNGHYTLEERRLLKNDVDCFLEHLQPISKSLSLYLAAVASRLLRIVYPNGDIAKTSCGESLTVIQLTNISDTQGSALRGYLEKCSVEITDRRGQLQEAQDSMVKKRLDLRTTACMVLEAQKDLMEAIIRVLEQIKYGSNARATKAQTDHLAIVAETMEAKLMVMKNEALIKIYTPDMRSALSNYSEHLQDTRMRLRQQEKTTNENLTKYEDVGSEMTEIADKYSSTLKEIKAIQADIKRLGGEA